MGIPPQLVHTNLCGPMQSKSLGMNSYFLIFIDDLVEYVGFIFSNINMRHLGILRNSKSWLRMRMRIKLNV